MRVFDRATSEQQGKSRTYLLPSRERLITKIVEIPLEIANSNSRM
jgi:hypothetical protein